MSARGFPSEPARIAWQENEDDSTIDDGLETDANTSPSSFVIRPLMKQWKTKPYQRAGQVSREVRLPYVPCPYTILSAVYSLDCAESLRSN